MGNTLCKFYMAGFFNLSSKKFHFEHVGGQLGSVGNFESSKFKELSTTDLLLDMKWRFADVKSWLIY